MGAWRAPLPAGVGASRDERSDGGARGTKGSSIHAQDEADLELDLPRALVAAGDARRALTRFCADRLEAELLEDAELMVSELVTNALRHGAGPIRMRAWLDDERLVVEVIDGGSGFEYALRREDVDEVGGWGLEIVEDASSRWGVREGTTHVWFELERPGPRLGEEPPPT